MAPAIAHLETYRSVDYHTGGEPFRIVTELPVTVEGADVPAKRVFAMQSPEIERIRQILCHEPRGHADMYGGFVVEPDDEGAHLGVLFWHKDGFSTACGHGTIALGTWAIESGLVAADPSGVTDVVIDVPSGRVTARVHTDAQEQVTGVDFINVPSYVLASDVPVETSRGELRVDVTFGGAIYAQLDAASAGLSVEPGAVDEIIALGREIKWLLNDTEYAKHPLDDRLSGIYGTIVFERLSDAPAGAAQDTEAGEASREAVPAGGTHPAALRPHQRNAAVFADGELDRSPCGSGTSARVATLTAAGVLGEGQELLHSSIVGSQFTAVVLERTTVAGRDAVIPRVTGTAHRTGEHVFTVDPCDELVPGFVLR
ncbi:proline racemase family protein [Brevibacterium album]|uniref:proline racemase family protein n=1 Tax=Brevibacterium album TaxID=417948 RepID=UPI000406C0BA|nr:proline racemase family protein [Brevibacterium album]